MTTATGEALATGRGQSAPAFIAAVTAGAIIGQQVAAKSARDALFLTNFGSRSLPGAMLIATAFSLLGVLGFSRALTRWSPARVVPAAFAVNALLIGGVWAASASMPRLASIVIYFHVSMFGATLISGFWSLVNERFDPHGAKRQVSKIVAGSTIGGILGGVLTWRWARSADVTSLFLAVSLMNVACVLGALSLGKGMGGERASARRELEAPAEAISAFHVLRTRPYLRHLALIVMLGGLTDAVFEYLLNAQAAASFADPRRLVSFFAIFQTATGLVSVLVQSQLTRPALRRLGLAGSVALLPVASLGGGMLAALLPRLATVTLMRGSEGIVKTSLFRAAYELLYTPLPPSQKRATKALIDVGFDRVGTALGSGLTMLALFLVAPGDIRLLLAVGATAALASVVVSRRLQSGYMSALEEGLRSGHAQAEPSEWSPSPWMPVDGPWQTRRTIKLVEHGPATPRPFPATAVAASRGRTTNAAVLRAIADLRSGSAKRIRRVLHEGIDRDLILAAHVIPLLGRDDLARDVAAQLKAIAPRISGQLADALVDPASEQKLRHRIARVLGAAPSPFAVAALMGALDDESFAVRHQAAMSLVHLSETDPTIRFDEAMVLGLARREIERGRETWGRETVIEAGDDGEPIVDELRARANRSLAQVVAVLSLVLEREPLWIAYHALHTDAEQLRGTALEYLENILPEDIRAALWPLLGALEPKTAPRREAGRIAEELLGARQSVMDHLRRSVGIG